MINFDSHHVSDPVHGTIGLSDLEVDVINTPPFQRLRNIKQLGLAPFVFPGADYSRFSHSIGVCHVTGRILQELNKNIDVKNKVEDKEIQLYRLAGLLHDIGHYPFSHPLEKAIDNHYSEKLIKPAVENSGEDSSGNKEDICERFFNHERVGKEILIQNPKLNKVLKSAGIEPKKISSIFTREKTLEFSNLISSDLDADRIDYLLRTAHHTGLPYGAVDLDYLLSQFRLDDSNRICLTNKGLRTVEHFLLSRYFDYQQVNYHKTVAAFELVLKDVVEALLEDGSLNCSAEWVSEAVSNKEEPIWQSFDDSYILEKIKTLQSKADSGSLKWKIKSILERKPPKLIVKSEFVGDKKKNTISAFRARWRDLIEKKPVWAKGFGIDESLWYIWKTNPITLTKIGSHVPVSSITESVDDEKAKNKDKYEQTVRIQSNTNNESKPITEVEQSLMSVLSNYALYPLRLYVLFPGGEERKRDPIRNRVLEDCPDIEFD